MHYRLLSKPAVAKISFTDRRPHDHGEQGRNYRPCSVDPALQGAADPGGPSRLPENIFFTTRLFQTIYGLALLRIEEFVGT